MVFWKYWSKLNFYPLFNPFLHPSSSPSRLLSFLLDEILWRWWYSILGPLGRGADALSTGLRGGRWGTCAPTRAHDKARARDPSVANCSQSAVFIKFTYISSVVTYKWRVFNLVAVHRTVRTSTKGVVRRQRKYLAALRITQTTRARMKSLRHGALWRWRDI